MKNHSVSPLARASKPRSSPMRRAFILSLACLLLAPPVEVFAQDSRVLIIDMERVRLQSTAGKEIREASAALRSEVRDGIEKRKLEILNEERRLAEERGRLSDEEFRTRVSSFEKKVFDQRKFAEEESRRLQGLIARAQQRLTRETQRVLTDLMRETGAELLLDKSQIVISVEQLDITTEVVERLNQSLPEGSFSRLDEQSE